MYHTERRYRNHLNPTSQEAVVNNVVLVFLDSMSLYMCKHTLKSFFIDACFVYREVHVDK